MKFIFFLFATFLSLILSGQEVEIAINNPSFEDIPHRGTLEGNNQIKGWYDCGQLQFAIETPPDIHPINAWQVTKGPSDGDTYLGMVIRDNDSWEAVTQRLPIPMEAGKCYAFNIDLSRSNFYLSGSRMTQSLQNYTNPAVLRIHGGTGVCGRQELLGESTTVSNDEWRTYEFKFEPQRTVNYFTLEAFYKTPTLIPYNGHILVDNASSIREVPCDGEQLEVTESTPEDPPQIAAVEKAKPSTTQTKKTAPVPIAELLEEEDIQSTPIAIAEQQVLTPEPKKEERIAGLEKKSYSKGEIIPIHNIYFAMDSSSVKSSSRGAIEQLVEFMKRNRRLVIEVGGHTNTYPPTSYCDELSSKRAKEVAKLLASRGVPAQRLRYRGYGKRRPLIANDLKDFKARAKNQRVEIKILMTDYTAGTG